MKMKRKYLTAHRVAVVAAKALQEALGPYKAFKHRKVGKQTQYSFVLFRHGMSVADLLLRVNERSKEMAAMLTRDRRWPWGMLRHPPGYETSSVHTNRDGIVLRVILQYDIEDADFIYRVDVLAW